VSDEQSRATALSKVANKNEDTKKSNAQRENRNPPLLHGRERPSWDEAQNSRHNGNMHGRAMLKGVRLEEEMDM
jgi:hypothetical protein